jgi:hypothetical protein
MKMSRRGFLTRVSTAIMAAAVAPDIAEDAANKFIIDMGANRRRTPPYGELPHGIRDFAMPRYGIEDMKVYPYTDESPGSPVDLHGVKSFTVDIEVAQFNLDALAALTGTPIRAGDFVAMGADGMWRPATPNDRMGEIIGIADGRGALISVGSMVMRLESV